MSRRSHGRPSPSRGARIERRKATRRPAEGGPTVMAIPDEIRALDPAGTTDHQEEASTRG